MAFYFDRKILYGALALLAGAFAFVFAAAAAEPQQESAAELLKQESIYKSRGEQVPGGYIVDRSLFSYVHALPAGFDRALAALGPQDRWLDVGAGEGRAILDYFSPRFEMLRAALHQRGSERAQAVAISIEDRRTLQWQEMAARAGAAQMRYLSGRRLREYTRAELGEFRLISDVTGGFSYTRDLTLYMQRALDALATGGDFYSLLVDVRSGDGAQKPFFDNTVFLTEIVRADGSAGTVCGWLKRIRCVEVSCESKAGWQPPVETYHLRKQCSDVQVPVLLPLRFEAGTPPQRSFRSAAD